MWYGVLLGCGGCGLITCDFISIRETFHVASRTKRDNLDMNHFVNVSVVTFLSYKTQIILSENTFITHFLLCLDILINLSHLVFADQLL